MGAMKLFNGLNHLRLILFDLKPKLLPKRTMFEGVCGTGKKSKIDPEDYYMSEDGYIVFKEQYHLKRGYCCKSGCKHCPYGYDKRTGRLDRK